MNAILLMHCPDQQGILAAVTNFINVNGGNILYLNQHVDNEEHVFFMRIEWNLDSFSIPKDRIAEYFETLYAARFSMVYSLHFSDQIPRMAIFVSKMSHCIYDMLARYASNEWVVEVPLIISNHPDLQIIADRFGIDFQLIPITKENKAEQEQFELDLLKKYKIDFIVLARYMQVISDQFIDHYPNRIINIHHSFSSCFRWSQALSCRFRKRR